MIPVLEWPGSSSGESSCFDVAMSNAKLLSDPVGKDSGEEEGLEGGF